MRALEVTLAFISVLLSSVGQVLLRHASQKTLDTRDGIAAYLNGTSLLAVGVYAMAMLAWFIVLRRMPLTQAFAFFGLSFFLVPLLAHRFLGDPVSAQTWLGASVIVAGIYITNWQPT